MEKKITVEEESFQQDSPGTEVRPGFIQHFL